MESAEPDMSPDLMVIERAVVVLAVVSVLQTTIIAGIMVVAYGAYRRAERTVGAELTTLRASLDETLRDTRAAARQVERLAETTSNLAEQTGSVIRTAATAVATPTVALAGAARLASRTLSRWRSRRSAPHSIPISIKEARHVSSR
jgi:hypothetical protein